MTRKIIDLSIYLENEVVSDPPPFCPKNALADCLERRKSRKATLTLDRKMAALPETRRL